MNKKEYPLAQVTEIKQKRLEDAEKVLEQKRDLLTKEQQKLKQVEGERDKVKLHKEDKLSQLRHELDTGTSTLTIEQMRLYLKEVDIDLKGKETKVAQQQKQVDAAQKAVDDAHQDMMMKRQSVEKMEIHKEEWSKEQKVEEAQKEAQEMDEIGNTLYNMKKNL